MTASGSTRVILSVICGIVAAVFGPVARGTCYDCKPIPNRIVEAEAIVIRRAVFAEQRETRPGLFATDFFHQIEEVLKGDQYRVGDIIVTHGEPRRRAREVRPPKAGRQAFVVFMKTGPDGELRSTHCGIPVEQADFSELLHLIDIDLAPQDYLDSTDELDIQMVHRWIGTNYFVRWSRGQEKEGVGDSLPISREDAIGYLARHAADEGASYQGYSVQLLGQFFPEEHRDLLTRIAEGSDTRRIRLAAQRALRRMDARLKAIGLIEELRALRRSWIGLPNLEAEAAHRRPVYDDAQYAMAIAELVGNLGVAGRPGLVRGFIRELETAGEQLGDEAILVPLLRLASTGSSWAEPFSRIFDTDALEEARARIYDDRDAVTLLAARGDEEVADFMIRLIRQGHRDGARWAATVQDASLIDDLLEAMHNSDVHASARMAYALGRMRAFEVMEQLPDADEFRWQQKARWFLLGLLNESFDWPGPYDWDRWSVRLDEYAEVESWSDDVRAQVGELRELVELDVKGGLRAPYHLLKFDTPWIPPAALPDMPDFLSSTDEVRAFLRENPNRVAEAVRWGSLTDRWNVINAAARAKVRLRPDLVGRLLADGSCFVQASARSYLRELAIVPSESELETWAFGGSNDATKNALDYFVKARLRVHAPIVEEVFHRGWHLYDGDLFRAIIATHALGCREQLRTYVEGHHIDLRRWSAIALAHLGDDTGRELILSMRDVRATNPNKANGSDAWRAWYVLPVRDQQQ